MNQENKLSGVIFIIFGRIIRRLIVQFFREHGMPCSNKRFEVNKTPPLFGSNSCHLIDGLISQIIFFSPHIGVRHNGPYATDRNTFAFVILITVDQAFRLFQVRKNNMFQNIILICTFLIDSLRILFSRFYKQRYVSPDTDSIEISQSTQRIRLSEVIITVCHIRHTDIRNIFDGQIGLVNHLIQGRPFRTFLVRRHQVVNHTCLIGHHRCSGSYVIRTEFTPIKIILA